MPSDATFLRDVQNHTQAKLLSELALANVVIVCQRNQVLLDVASRTAPAKVFIFHQSSFAALNLIA